MHHIILNLFCFVFATPSLIPVIQVATHHVMRHQSPAFTAGQRRLPRRQRDRGHVEMVCLAPFPWQQLLQSSQTKYDWFGGVRIIMLDWAAQEHGKINDLHERRMPEVTWLQIFNKKIHESKSSAKVWNETWQRWGSVLDDFMDTVRIHRLIQARLQPGDRSGGQCKV